MTIDIIFLLAITYGFYKGFSKGLVMAVLSLAGYITAIIATMFFTKKIIVLVNWHSVYAPIVCYVGLFITVVLLFRLVGKLIESMLEMVELTIVNKLIGGLIGVTIITALFSCIIWMLLQINILPNSVQQSSQVVQYLIPAGHFSVEIAGKLFPTVKEFFFHCKTQLQELAK
jgi:membrane protein required for colicin V production